MKNRSRTARPRHRVNEASISRALNAAARDAVELHRRLGLPLAVWKDGKVALVPADEVETKPKRSKARRGKSRR